MAKSKRKSKSVLKYLKYVAVVMGVLGLVMSALTFVNCGDATFSGFNVIFGYVETIGALSSPLLSFSILALFIVVLPFLVSFLALSKNKALRVVAALVMLAGAILCFLIPNFVVFADSVAGTALKLAGVTLGIGAILSGVCYVVGALTCLFTVIKK